ncbi:hypothetical protein ACGFZB_31410 [Streptomyces cinerochromogenes]|uniref:Uncharacterized protein n=1 Tax=Streptomyces cinerochromogenes TaxID=66422 RepID=A0ABW7BCL5_9ACTN
MTDMSSVTLPARVDPEKLGALLEDAGWKRVGGRRGIYSRYLPPKVSDDWPEFSLMLPLDEEAPEFPETMRLALLQLSQDRDFWLRSVYPRLIVEASDEFKFRKESSAPSGFIEWRSGERLVESARRTLLAGAKSYMGPDRHFVNRHGRFAHRYLDQILMGQSAPGSYIITAYAPPNAGVPLSTSSTAPSIALPELGLASVRDVSQAVVRAVQATIEALDHYRSSGSLSGFEAGVVHGISYEMTNALLGIAENSDGADISVEWDPAIPSPDELDSRFELQGSDVVPLNKAAMKLASDDSSRFTTMIGRVHLLAKKQAGSPGVFGIEALASGPAKKVRVRLSDEEEYHEAVRAHEEDLALQVSGRLEKEGNLSWLYDATVLRTLGPISDYARPSRPSVMRGQISLFADEVQESPSEQ